MFYQFRNSTQKITQSSVLEWHRHRKILKPLDKKKEILKCCRYASHIAVKLWLLNVSLLWNLQVQMQAIWHWHYSTKYKKQIF